MHKRDISIDCIKGILTLIMVLAHVVAIFPCGMLSRLISEYANLTTFSGFFFCLGYVCYKAYIRKDTVPYRNILKGMGKAFAAFLVSSFFSILWLWNVPASAPMVISIFTLERLAPYSEFLLSFVYCYGFLLIGCGFLKRLLSKKVYVIAAVAVCLISTFIPYHSVTFRPLGALIGTATQNFFPLLQYGGYFLVGAYLSKNDLFFDKKLFAATFLPTALFAGYCLYYRTFPSRFPPSIYWIGGAAFVIYCYYLVCKLFCRLPLPFLQKPLASVGKNSLTYLLVSNLILFAAKYYQLQRFFPTIYIYYVFMFMAIVTVCAITVFVCKIPHMKAD